MSELTFIINVWLAIVNDITSTARGRLEVTHAPHSNLIDGSETDAVLHVNFIFTKELLPKYGNVDMCALYDRLLIASIVFTVYAQK